MGAHKHAEMSVLHACNGRKGDTLFVVRFLSDGSITMAKPCPLCEQMIKDHGIRKVYYTDWNGEWQRL